MLTKEEFEAFPNLEPVYPLTQGLTSKTLQKAMSQLIPAIPDLEEWQDPEWLKQKNWPSFQDALTSLHRPEEIEDIKADSKARQRLAYDELLAKQLSLALVRRQLRAKKDAPLKAMAPFATKSLKPCPLLSQALSKWL